MHLNWQYIEGRNDKLWSPRALIRLMNIMLF